MSAIAGTLKSKDRLKIPILGMAQNLVKSDHFNRCDYVICVSDAVVMAQHARMETVKGHHVVLSALEKVAPLLKDIPWYVWWIGDGTLRAG